MTVARLLGVAPVKMLDSGQTLVVNTYGANYSPLNFDPQSDNPMLSNAANVLSKGDIGNFSSVVMANLGGPSEMLVNPIDQPLGGFSQLYMDGVIWFLGEPDGVNIQVYYRPQPRQPGNWSSAPFSWYPVTQILPAPMTLLPFGNGSLCPLMDRGEKVIGAMTNSSSDIHGKINVVSITDTSFVASNNFNVGAFPFPYSLTKLSCRETNPSSIFDNYVFLPAMGVADGGPAPCRIMAYQSRNISNISFDPIQMDNPTLDALFQVAHGPLGAKSYVNGFIFPLVTRGAGVTGQWTEVCVFTKDMTGYYILQLIPMDAEATLQLESDTGNAQVKIDGDGIVWYNTGDGVNQTKVLTSFSSGFQFPVYYFGNLNPISLPCYVDSMPGTTYSDV